MAGANDTPHRILLVDDEPIVAQGLRALVERETMLDLPREARTTGEARTRLAEAEYSLVVLEVAIEGNRGLELVRDAASRDGAGLAVLVYSRRAEGLHAQRSLRAGARGFVSKREPTDVLLGAIWTVLGESVHVSPRLSSRGADRAVAAHAPTSETAPVETLTDRELEVFELLGEGWTTSEISDKLDLGLKTVQSYCGGIKSKLALRNNNQLIRRSTHWVLEGR